MGDAPLNPSRLANGQGFRPPPTLHDLQMDKGLGPPNPSRLANGQGFRPPPNPSRLANGQGFRPPQPFTKSKWTRVAGPPTLHDLGAASKWTRVGAPPQPFTTCKWTRVAPPNPSRLANGQGLGAPQPFTTWGRLPNGQARFANGQGLGPNPSRLPHDLQMDKGWGPQPFTTCEWTRVGGPPTLHDLQTSNFVCTSIGASKPSNA